MKTSYSHCVWATSKGIKWERKCLPMHFQGFSGDAEISGSLWKRKKMFENSIRITYLIQEQTKKMEDAAWNKRSIRHSFGDREKVWRREDNKGNSSRINAVAFSTVSIFFQSIWAFITSHSNQCSYSLAELS